MDISSKENILNRIRENKMLCSECCFKKHFPEFYFNLLTWKFPDNFVFKQKLYHYLHDDFDLKIGLCPECGNRCGFINIFVGYRKYCSSKCAQNAKETKRKFKQTCLERFGCENPSQSAEIHKKKIETNRTRLGTNYPAQSDIVKEKSKLTNLNRRGVEYASQSEEFKNNVKRTCQVKYGCDNVSQLEDVKEKRKQTCLERYNEESYSKTTEWKEKSEQTSLDRYGCKYYSQSDERNKKYEDSKFVEYVLNKQKETNLEKFGAEWYFQSDEYKDKYKDFEWVKDKFDKQKESNLETFGTEWYFQSEEFKRKFENYEWVQAIQNKIYNTKKKNNSFHTSKIEEQLQQYFINNNISFIYQYKSDQYPFNCDFYFPDKDLYVEIQGSWTHGGKPFTGSEDDLKLVEKWQLKNSKYYNIAINTWTKRDVIKRNVAKQNKLNYLEIFSTNLNECIEKIKGALI